MGINPSDPLFQLKVTSATCSFVAIVTTLYRIYVRRTKIWADDLFAVLALVALILQIVSVFLHVPLPNNLSNTTRVAAYYLLAHSFYVVIWASRVAILLSIVRVDPSATRRRRLTWAAGGYVFILLILMAQLLWVCEPEPKWKSAANPQCVLPSQVAIAQLITDIMADSILLYAPLRLFQRLHSRSLRIKLSIIFSTCVATTIVSFVHAALLFRKAGNHILIAALVEDCISLIVANLPVVVAASVSLKEDDQVHAYPTLSMRGPESELSAGRPVTFPSSSHGGRNPQLTSSDLVITMDTVVEQGYGLGLGKDDVGDFLEMQDSKMVDLSTVRDATGGNDSDKKGNMGLAI